MVFSAAQSKMHTLHLSTRKKSISSGPTCILFSENRGTAQGGHNIKNIYHISLLANECSVTQVTKIILEQ